MIRALMRRRLGGVRSPLIRAFSTSPCKSESEWNLRVDLALSYRLCWMFGYSEGVCNHLSVALPCNTKFLMIRYGQLWSDVKASDLALINMDGTVDGWDPDKEPPYEFSAYHIHRNCHLRGKKAATACFHTHQPYSTTMTCLKGQASRVQMVHQNSVRFHNQVSYWDGYEGLGDEHEEGDRIAMAMHDKKVLLGRNHGIVVWGSKIAEAWDDLYYFEQAAKLQCLALAAVGGDVSKLAIIPTDTVEFTFQQFENNPAGPRIRFAEQHFQGLKEHIQKTQPDCFT